MRVISMVPSWTETLIAAGVEVVGRTRFCIHPKEAVRAIPAVGGTKDIDWQKVGSLKPDLLILDREENPRKMADEAPCPVHATHVTSIATVAPELSHLAERLGSERLKEFARRWQAVEARPSSARPWSELPGVLDWIERPTSQTKAVYAIWKNPWMAAGPETFIGSVLGHLGVRDLWPAKGERYPEFRMEDVPEEAVLLFSSEPYPFHKRVQEIKALGRAAATVDGESFSWFGLRSLEFLERSV